MFFEHFPSTSRKPTFVLVHGLASDSHDWDVVTPILRAKDFGVVVVDLLGHGRSVDEAGTTLSEQVDAVARVLATLPLDEVVFAGHSYGGAVAAALAAESPNTVGVSLMAPFILRIDPPWTRVLGPLPDIFIEWALRHFIARRRPENAPLLVRKKARVATVLAREILQHDTTTDALAVAAPIQLVLAKRDRLLPRAQADALLAVLKNATLFELQGSHFMTDENPQQLAEILIAGVSAANGSSE